MWKKFENAHSCNIVEISLNEKVRLFFPKQGLGSRDGICETGGIFLGEEVHWIGTRKWQRGWWESNWADRVHDGEYSGNGGSPRVGRWGGHHLPQVCTVLRVLCLGGCVEPASRLLLLMQGSERAIDRILGRGLWGYTQPQGSFGDSKKTLLGRPL